MMYFNSGFLPASGKKYWSEFEVFEREVFRLDHCRASFDLNHWPKRTARAASFADDASSRTYDAPASFFFAIELNYLSSPEYCL